MFTLLTHFDTSPLLICHAATPIIIAYYDCCRLTVQGLISSFLSLFAATIKAICYDVLPLLSMFRY